MPANKTKSSNQPEPSKEPPLQSLSAYVDDRLELLKHVFSSLQPKTIKKIAPEFLQHKSIETLKKLCLEELLGISKKRLLSVINASECPSNTESSSSEEEHISYEEISSDSDVELVDPSRHKKKPKKEKKIKVEKNGAEQKKVGVDKKEKKKSEKEMTVLELLELQARARAIRSQLALEPVTKIELDSDDSVIEEGTKPAEPTPVEKEPPEKRSKKKRKKASKESEKPSTSASSAAKKPSSSSASTSKRPTSTAKPVKLKRNFLSRTTDDSNQPTAVEKPSTSKETAKEEPEKMDDRESSPDVIPIQPEPETFCISDSDAEEERKIDLKDKTPPHMSPKKDEERQSPAIISINTEEDQNKDSKETTETIEEIISESPQKEKTPPPPSPKEKTPPPPSPKEKTPPPPSPKDIEEIHSPGVLSLDAEDLNDLEKDPSDTEKRAESPATPKELEQKSPTPSPPPAAAPSPQPSSSAEQPSQEPDNDPPKEPDKASETESDEPDADIVCIQDSSDEEALNREHEESWGQRWLRSSKVKQVMVTSKLANRTRKTLKKKKAEEVAAAQAVAEKRRAEEEAREAERKERAKRPVTQHEIGSVEHYKELLARVHGTGNEGSNSPKN